MEYIVNFTILETIEIKVYETNEKQNTIFYETKKYCFSDGIILRRHYIGLFIVTFLFLL